MFGHKVHNAGEIFPGGPCRIPFGSREPEYCEGLGDAQQNGTVIAQRQE
jgi:hypothetical protein